MLKRVIVGAVLAAVFVWASAASAQSTSELLEKGIYTEETVGDLDGAIKIYEKIIEEAKANRQYVAQAQLRLGQCLAKKGKKEEAEKVFRELVEQFKDSPDQKELVEKARKLLPDETGLNLEPVPWVDGEHLEMRIKLGGGMEIGAFTLSARKGEDDGRKVWDLSITRDLTANAPNLGFSRVIADRETFDPIRSLFRHSMLGTFKVDYSSGKAVVHTEALDGKESERTTDLDGVHYDNEQGWHLFRRLPLAEGYKGTTPIYASFGAGAIELGVEVTGEEELEVPAGAFDCYKLFITPVQQTFWISKDAHRYVVKFEAGGVTGVLQSIRQVEPGDTITQTDDEVGFSVTAPADWYFLPQEVGVEKPGVFYVLMDPRAEAFTFLRSHPLDSLAEEERESVRAWADKKLARTAKKVKDLQVREESWQEFEVNGLPAVRCVADFLQGETKRVGYSVFILGDSTATEIGAQLDPEALAEFRNKLDPIIATYEEK